MKTIIKILIWAFLIYWFYVVSIRYAIDNWLTNSESQEITITLQEEKLYQLPDEIINAKCVQFILKGITKRKTFNNAVIETSEKLWLDYNIVMSAILGEQIRISCKGVRWDLKAIILNSTPTLFRSHNTSIGIAGLKLNTAFKIKSDAIKYWYGDGIKNIWINEEILSDNDKVSWIYATYLVKNIIHRRWLSWYDISKDAWVVGTLYNIWNYIKKVPHADPKIGWAIITIGSQKFTYGEISLWIFNYLTNKIQEIGTNYEIIFVSTVEKTVKIIGFWIDTQNKKCGEI